MAKVEVFYIGRKPVMRDAVIAGTGLAWTPGQSHMVEAGAASKLLAHRDVWAASAPDNWADNWADGTPVQIVKDRPSNTDALMALPLRDALAMGLVIWTPTKPATDDFGGHKETGTPTGKWVLGDAAPVTPPAANDDGQAQKEQGQEPAVDKPAEDAQSQDVGPDGLLGELRALGAEELDARLGAMSDDEVRDIGNSLGDAARFSGRNKGQQLRIAVADLLTAKG